MATIPFPQPLPSDVYEVDLRVSGVTTPYAQVLAGGVRLGTAAGPTGTIFVPRYWYNRADYSGSLLATVVCAVAGLAGALSPGTTLYSSGGAVGVTEGAARVSEYGRFARELAQILGTAYQPANGTLAAADLTSLGGALATIRATSLRSIDQAFADAASDLLTELEIEFGLANRTDLSTADRRARLAAKVRAYIAGTAQNIDNAVSAYDSTAVVHENVPQAGAGSTRVPFQFGVTVSDGVYDSVIKNAAIVALIEQMKPAHTRGNLGTKKGFYTNEATSLTNRTLI
jgi:hypothetical protein